MKALIPGLFLWAICVQSSYAQQPPSETIKTATNNTPEQQDVINLSKQKWNWMAEKNVDSLNMLFDDKAMFVHMGGSWGKQPELNTIKSGGIWYKKAEVYSVIVNIIGNTAILLNDIDLEAVVGGNTVTNPFMVTEVYIKENGVWKMGSLTFSHLLRPVKGRVNIHPVTYKLNGIDIAANVYTPANYDSSKKYPAIAIAHPNGGIKEQAAGLYAQRLAEAGYITIAADAAYQGASGGEPRHTDKPANRIEDIHGMADFITHYPGVDANRLGVLGICGGGGYTLKAAQSDKRFKAVATLSMFNSGEVRRNGFQNSQLNTIQERLKQASDARAQEAAGGEITYAGVASITDEEIARVPTNFYRQGYEYYYRTHAHPNSTFLYTMSSLLDLMTWDATTDMDLINQPLLMIAGSKAQTKYMTDEAFPKATNAKSKELFVIDGATHIETYWKPEYVKQIVEKLTALYGKNL